jgi:D-alanyl-D-alanine dipeptidase
MSSHTLELLNALRVPHPHTAALRTTAQLIASAKRLRFLTVKAIRIFVGILLLLTLTTRAADKPDLVNVEKFIPGIVLDIRYATTNNFTGKQVYPVAKCLLRRSTAEKLKAVQADLQKQNLGLKVYDGYRPLSVQKKFWEIMPDDRYVANPAKGSKHNRGGAVDLTLIDAKGKELPMPTAYDDFSEKAHRNYKNLPEEVIRNRDLLGKVMEKHGFAGLDTEWWHFDDRDWKNFELLDIGFEGY